MRSIRRNLNSAVELRFRVPVSSQCEASLTANDRRPWQERERRNVYSLALKIWVAMLCFTRWMSEHRSALVLQSNAYCEKECSTADFRLNNAKPKKLKLALCFMLAAGIATSTNARNKTEKTGIDQPHQVLDFAYGEFLYDYYQNNFFNGITRLLVAKEKNQLQQQSDYADVLLGSVYIAYGLLDEAEAIFLQLIDESVGKETNNKAWFHLATLKYKQGDYAKAKSILSNKLIDPEPSLEAQAKIIESLIFLKQRYFVAAEEKLKEIPKKTRIETYTRYNLAVAFTGLGQEAKSTQLLDNLLVQSKNTQDRLLASQNNELNETLAIKDLAALVLGMKLLGLEEYNNAQSAFEQVRLDSPYANRALLGLGWAHLNSSTPKRAFTPWLELSNRSKADPAVQEAYLNIPHAYEKLGALQDALEGYLKAHQIYSLQRHSIERIISRIGEDKWIAQMSPDPTYTDDPLDVIPPFTPPKDLEAYYLYAFFASNQFNESYRNYRELQRLRQLVGRWQNKLPTYTKMITANEERLDQALNKSAQTVADALATKDSIEAQHTDLDERIQNAVSGKDLLITATEKELALYQRIELGLKRLEPYADDELVASQIERLKLFSGFIEWDLVQEQSERSWEIEKSAQQLNQSLTELELAVRKVDNAENIATNRYRGFGKRIEAFHLRLNQLTENLDASLQGHRAYLQRIAIGIMQENLTHINELQAQALLASSRLADRSYTEARSRALESEAETIEPSENNKKGEQAAKPREKDNSTNDTNKNDKISGAEKKPRKALFEPGEGRAWYEFWKRQ